MRSNPVRWFAIYVQAMGESGSSGALVRVPGVPSGASMHREKMSIGEYGYIVLAVDTEGNMLGLHSLA
jgi:uncharacterized protein